MQAKKRKTKTGGALVGMKRRGSQLVGRGLAELWEGSMGVGSVRGEDTYLLRQNIVEGMWCALDARRGLAGDSSLFRQAPWWGSLSRGVSCGRDRRRKGSPSATGEKER